MPLDFLSDTSPWLDELTDRIAWWERWLRKNRGQHATIDFETKSVCDLKKHGSWLYSKHESTKVMCLAYMLPTSDEVHLWHQGYDEFLISESQVPTELFAFILAGGLVEAHNVMFERCIWTHVCNARMDWPLVPPEQWRCSASRASACSLPRDLDGATAAMGLDEKKDKEGHRLMLRMSKPRKPLKAEIVDWMEQEGLTGDYRRYQTKFTAANGPMWHETEEDLYRLWAYCKQDVRAEHALSRAMPNLGPKELELWQLDQEVNWRGTRIDLELCHAALRVVDEHRKKLNAELYEMTGISAATKRQQVKDWLEEHEDLELPDTAAETLDKYIDGKLSDEVEGRARRVLEILRDVNRTSTRKYSTAINKTDPEDGRARDLLMYHGANTGRWSGKGIQVQNFPRGTAKNDVYWDKKAQKWVAFFNMDKAAEDIKDGDVDYIAAFYDGGVMEALSSATRGILIPSEGMDMMVADYSAIEARCVLWEAGDTRALEVFTSGGDIYCDMATGIYGYEVNKKDHPNERQFGKQAILGLGYGMGYITFLLTCRKYKISFGVEQVQGILGDKFTKYMDWVNNQLFPVQKEGEDKKRFANRKRQAARTRRQLIDADEDPAAIVHELALMKYTVDVYRSRYPKVKEMWRDQERAAMEAVYEWEKLVRDAQDKERIAWEKLGLEIDFGAMHWEKSEFIDQIEGPAIECGCTTWQCIGGFLLCFLPSGRPLRYRTPFIKPSKTTWGEVKDGLRYMSVVKQKWVRTSTYGGKLVENITQAVARDIMSDALLRMRGDVYRFLISVHDEMVTEVPQGEGSVEDFEEKMATIDDWAQGCPVAAEGDRLPRYRK